MGNNLGHARKLEPTDDASASGPRDTFDLSNADPTDSEILDEQAVLDILESAPYAPSDQSSGDGQDDIGDKDETVRSRTYVFKSSSLNERLNLEELAKLAASEDEPEVEERIATEQRDPSKEQQDN